MTEELSTSKLSEDALIKNKNFYVNKIKEGVCVLVKMSSSKQGYIYLGKASSEVKDNSKFKVKIMFLKSMDYIATNFKLLEPDL